MKKCNICNELKPISDFYKGAAKCKPCNIQYVKEYRLKNIDRVRAYDRGRSHLPHRVALRKAKLDSIGLYCVIPEKHPAYCSLSVGVSYYRRNATRLNKKTKIYQTNNPLKLRAQSIIGNAVRDGKIDKPVLCQYCGTYSKLQGHHCDYSKPLDVQWLCVPCHKQWHITNGEGLNG